MMIVWAQEGSGSRRAFELSHRLGFDLRWVWPERRLPMPLRLLWSLWHSITLVRKERPPLLVVQVGPAVAAYVGVVARALWRIPFVLDCHTGVFVDPRERRLHRFTAPAFRRARAVVVHDPSNVPLARRLGVDAAVLPDAVPAFPDRVPGATREVRHPSVLVPASWRSDEPVDAVLGAARALPEVTWYVSGRAPASLVPPSNVVLTGRVSSAEYLELLFEVDAVVALTTRESTMLCAAYEALGAAQPLVVSATGALTTAFGSAAWTTTNDADALAEAVRAAVSDRAGGRDRSRRLAATVDEAWASAARTAYGVTPGEPLPRA
jgi:glycosyltransferase involved in cell wall biosynthesis